MGTEENWYAVSNDNMNDAIMLTWPTDTGSNLYLNPVRRQQLERIVGEMARAIRTEPERLDAAVAEREATIDRLTRELADARSALRAYAHRDAADSPHATAVAAAQERT